MYYSFYRYPIYSYFPVPQSVIYYPYLPYREYPPVDPTMLIESVNSYRVLLDQGRRLLDKLGDKTFSMKLMEAAQHGNQAEVDRLIHTIVGISVPIKVSYTPSGVIFTLESPALSKGANCCTLKITLKWGK
ncbi:MAG TPA: hypothetical protein VKZ77_13860 [Bacillaceae bacterium]|nr:hypothetical protein [Bacillaceae bacterium]